MPKQEKKQDNNKESATDKFDRAFAALDSKAFPDKHKPKLKKPSHQKAALLPENDEANLFLQAVGAIRGEEKMQGFAPMADIKPKLRAEKDKIKGKTDKFAPKQPEAASSHSEKTSSSTLTTLVPEEDAELARLYKELQDVTPLQGKARMPAPPPVAGAPGLVPSPLDELQALVDGSLDFTMSGSDEYFEGHVAGLDLLTVAKLQARHYSPEGHIDLHGLNSQQAYANLVIFVRDAYQRGKRTLLVVTGRGKNSPDGSPVLRSKVQEWFTQDPFRRVVLAFCCAKREDGGPGALYVLLRKFKKKQGKVRWDRMPSDPDLFII